METSVGGARVHPVTVEVRAEDDLTVAAARAYLGTRPEVSVAAPGAEATVVLVLASVIGDDTWRRMGARRSPSPPPMVVVADAMDEDQLRRAVTAGLASVLPRRALSWDRVVGAVVAAAHGEVELSAGQVRWLLDRVRSLDQGAGPAAGGMSAREVEVLRLLADGHGTGEIAALLSFSERTIKNVIQAVMGRYDLRSRSHAVAHALRAGVL